MEILQRDACQGVGCELRGCSRPDIERAIGAISNGCPPRGVASRCCAGGASERGVGRVVDGLADPST